MVMYPKIADLHYKDKHIDIKIPIRVQLIKFPIFRCEQCEQQGSERQINSYFLRKIDLKGVREPDKKGIFISFEGRDYHLKIHEQLVYQNQIICPACLFGKPTPFDKPTKMGKKFYMNPRLKKLIKVYPSNYNPYLKMDYILQLFISRRIRERNKGRYGKVALYVENLEDAKSLFKENKNIKVYDTTMEGLEKLYENYLVRKAARAI